MPWLAAHRLALLVALGALLAGLGAGLALAPARTGTRTRTVTVASITTRTVTSRVARTRTRTVTVPAAAQPTPTPPSASAPARPPGAPAPAPAPSSSAGVGGAGAPELRYAGTGPRVLGTVTVRHESTLRWTSSSGRFRLFYNRTGVAVDSTAPFGQTGAPAMTYTDVKVDATGRWTIRIG